jgi:hypothetical protein
MVLGRPPGHPSVAFRCTPGDQELRRLRQNPETAPDIGHQDGAGETEDQVGRGGHPLNHPHPDGTTSRDYQCTEPQQLR